MLNDFDYPQFRARFIQLQADWWRDKVLWKDYDFGSTIYRPTEQAAFQFIARQCKTYNKADQQRQKMQAFGEVVREVLIDMKQEQLYTARIQCHRMSLRDLLARRGETVAWFESGTTRQFSEVVPLRA
jgi:hypothetical protein